MNLKANEQLCIVCDGAGTAPGGCVWELKICSGCNGHGVVIYDKLNHRTIKFDVEATIFATKKATIGA